MNRKIIYIIIYRSLLRIVFNCNDLSFLLNLIYKHYRVKSTIELLPSVSKPLFYIYLQFSSKGIERVQKKFLCKKYFLVAKFKTIFQESLGEYLISTIIFLN